MRQVSTANLSVTVKLMHSCVWSQNRNHLNDIKVDREEGTTRITFLEEKEQDVCRSCMF